MKKTWTLMMASAALIGSTLLSGCSTAGTIAGDSATGQNPYILAYDSSFARQVSVVDVAHHTVGDLMQAQVTLRSNRNRSLLLTYKFAWFDATGLEIDPQSKPYRSLTIEGRDGVTVSSVAPNPQATEFKMKVRKVKSLKIQNIR